MRGPDLSRLTTANSRKGLSFVDGFTPSFSDNGEKVGGGVVARGGGIGLALYLSPLCDSYISLLVYSMLSIFNAYLHQWP